VVRVGSCKQAMTGDEGKRQTGRVYKENDLCTQAHCNETIASLLALLDVLR
jgi:hypothetical protein